MRAAVFFLCFCCLLFNGVFFKTACACNYLALYRLFLAFFLFGWPWTFVAYRCNTLSFISAVRP